MNPAPRIIAFGDSLTYGYPYGHSYSWVNLVAEALNLKIMNHGNNGDSLADLRRRIISDVLDLRPDYCIITAGTNDVFLDRPLKAMQEDVEKMLGLMAEYKIKAIIGLPPPVLDKKKEAILIKYRNWLKKIAKTKKLHVLDFYKAYFGKNKSLNRKFFEDTVHPNADGYAAMADAAKKLLDII